MSEFLEPDEFVRLFKKAYPSRTDTDFVPSGSHSFRINCPLCERRSKNKTADREHSLSVDLKAEKPGRPIGAYKCFRCMHPETKGWGFSHLLKKYHIDRKSEGPRPVVSLSDLKTKKRTRPPSIGELVPVSTLPRTHIAKQILKRDFFTDAQIEFLADAFHLQYCVNGRSLSGGDLTHRLVVPIFARHFGEVQAVGWQARWLPPSADHELYGEEAEKAHLKDIGHRKYLISPGFDRHSYPYNMDRVFRQRKRVIILEGFKKAWKAPNHGIGLMGKQSLQSSLPNWTTSLNQFEEVIFAFDRDAYDMAVINSEILKELAPSHQRIIALELPEGEPDDVDKYLPSTLRKLCDEQIAKTR